MVVISLPIAAHDINLTSHIFFKSITCPTVHSIRQWWYILGCTLPKYDAHLRPQRWCHKWCCAAAAASVPRRQCWSLRLASRSCCGCAAVVFRIFVMYPYHFLPTSLDVFGCWVCFQVCCDRFPTYQLPTFLLILLAELGIISQSRAVQLLSINC